MAVTLRKKKIDIKLKSSREAELAQIRAYESMLTQAWGYL
jgi:hypothetical protein